MIQEIPEKSYKMSLINMPTFQMNKQRPEAESNWTKILQLVAESGFLKPSLLQWKTESTVEVPPIILLPEVVVHGQVQKKKDPAPQAICPIFPSPSNSAANPRLYVLRKSQGNPPVPASVFPQMGFGVQKS